jgi:hypothetical protein
LIFHPTRATFLSMSEKYSIGGKFIELLLGVVHRWSGEVLGKPTPAPVLDAPPTPAPSPATITAPVTIPGVVMTKQHLVALTALLEPGMADELTQLAQVMQTNESDVLLRLIKIAHMIREFGLYGVPTPDGNQLGIYVRRTQEVHKINLECPAQKNHHPQEVLGGEKTPSRLN